MPDLPLPKSKNKIPADPSILEEDDDDDADPDDPDPPHPIDDDHNAPRAPPPPPPPQPHPNPVPPPPPAAENSRWDYIFDTDNIPVPSLSQPEDIVPEPPAASAAPKIPAEKVVVSEPSGPPPKLTKKPKPAHHHQAASAGASVEALESKRGRMVAAAGPTVNLLQVLNDLDDHFLKASESAHDVSKMLEATRMHYHSNFADNRGHIDHSARVMRVITWNRSIKGMNNDDGGKDDFDNEESETHATVLDKMLAWEKKLYDEVKAGELMKIEYQKKVALLTKQKKRGASPETIEKTKAAVSHLHTRYIIDMQSMDSTVSEINRLRDKQLYPKLVDLVEGMTKMWETMHMHHSSQLKIVSDLRNLDISFSPKETSEQHHDRTIQLWKILREWHSRFQELISHQKEYIKALNSWLKLNLMPIESSLKGNGSSPSRVTQPSIHPLLRAWHDLLAKLPDELARGAIYSFSEVIRTIMIIQEEELKLKEKCEETRREYMRKKRAFEEWHQKYLQKKATEEAAASSEEVPVHPESGEEAIPKDLVAERKAVVESLRMRLADEEESYQRTCRQVREKSVANLRTHLPELFRAMSDFALVCSEMYKKLRSINAQSQETTTAN